MQTTSLCTKKTTEGIAGSPASNHLRAILYHARAHLFHYIILVIHGLNGNEQEGRCVNVA